MYGCGVGVTLLDLSQFFPPEYLFATPAFPTSLNANWSSMPRNGGVYFGFGNFEKCQLVPRRGIEVLYPDVSGCLTGAALFNKIRENVYHAIPSCPIIPHMW
jgi:hypothetical protein